LKQGTEINISQFIKPIKSFLLPKGLVAEDLKVRKMKILKNKTSIQFNEQITISNIPQEVWEYKINGWSAPKWIVERYPIQTR